ncbi:Cof-type HAD-IIB family hydrolase [Paraliobacillus ryukyuensis]|uniref:Cof-type HAD-IIB family hydrolase n=1 Tax=Paraliobacillus ryukyuensis TaxID=200904 RepID=UPI0009A7DCE9|nr:Cof-type HAD-IIB family hydrolase [Paraliobacillus ryukyuensis]
MTLKAIFSDIDGTLLNSNHQITEETKKAILKVANNNIHFVLVSARMPSGILQLQQTLSIDSPIICYSGALILSSDNDNGEKTTIDSTSIVQTDVQEIYKIVNKLSPINFSLYSHDQWVVSDSQNEWVLQEQEITNASPIHRQLPLFIEENHDIHKCLCMGETQIINQLESILKDKFPNLTIYKSKDTYLEIMSGNASKSNAIKKLENLYGITKQEIMAIGDNFNDMDMLKYAGLGVAMGNAPEEVKVIADEVTLSNDENGLKHTLQKHF